MDEQTWKLPRNPGTRRYGGTPKKANEPAFSGAPGRRLRGGPQTAVRRARRLVTAGDGQARGFFDRMRPPSDRPRRHMPIVVVARPRQRAADLAAQDRGGMGPGASMAWRFGMRLAKHLGLEPVRMHSYNSGNNGAINATVMVVRVPGRTKLVEHQQQQDQPTGQPMRSARRRGAQGSLGTGTGRTHGNGGGQDKARRTIARTYAAHPGLWSQAPVTARP